MSDAVGLLLAAAELILPVVVGRLAAPRVRSAGGRAALALLPVGLGVTVDAAALAVDVWDVVLVALGLGVGLARPSWRALARAGLGVALFAGVAEGVGRARLPAAPDLVGEDQLSVAFRGGPRNRDLACGFMYPDADPDRALERAAAHVPEGAPVVLHVGDSMLVFSEGFPPSSSEAPDRFPRLLDAADPRRRHVSLGMPGSSYDAQLVAVRAALQRLHVEQVVLYAFLKNDLAEVGRRYPCCDAPLVVDVDRPGLPDACAEPVRTLAGSSRLHRLFTRSQAPLAVRVLSRTSVVAGHLRARLLQVGGISAPWAGTPRIEDGALPDDDPVLVRGWEVAHGVIRALRDELGARGIGLTVVGLPAGDELPKEHGQDAPVAQVRTRRLGDFCADEGVPFVDAWPAFPEIPVDPSDFLDDRHHFSRSGHRRMAAFLAPRLGVPWKAPSGEPPPRASSRGPGAADAR